MTDIRLVSGLPDWRDATAYAPLLAVDRRGFAWEFLRRHPTFREQAGLLWTGRELNDPVPDLVIAGSPDLNPWGLRFRDSDQSRRNPGPTDLGPRRGYKRRHRQH